MQGKKPDNPDHGLEMEVAEELGFGHMVSEGEGDWRENLTDREIALLNRALLRRAVLDDEDSQDSGMKSK